MPSCGIYIERQTDRQTDTETETETETYISGYYSARALWVLFCWLLFLRSVIACTRRAFQQSERPVTTRQHARAARSTWADLHPLLTVHHSYCPHHVSATSSFCPHPPPSTLSPRAPLPFSSFNFISAKSSSMIRSSKMKNASDFYL